ncbi:RNA-guided endonuclease InsQ/TnpB family protein [Streptomyces endophyticus]|uniref:Transposase n=1 Tax=Streptomyces endophyticus TaxID=714166 RepID=A0ABU6FJK6_9ACTN|nr:transposase [Streptomyces endophyticus]MEB8344228.1 transposase [Streptomyces endophyticus]
MTVRAVVTGASGAGHARYTYRLRVSVTAGAALSAEWDRCRWVWNECVAKSRAVHQHNLAHPEEKLTCGPAQLDRMLTRARHTTSWLREGSTVPQQQIIRDFGKARTKALKDIRDHLPVRQRTGRPQWKSKRDALPSLNYTRRGFRLRDGCLELAGGTTLTVVWSRDLPADPSSVRVYQDTLGHWYASFVVPATVDPLPATGAVIGIDWGVKETATTTSHAHDLPHAEHGTKAKAHKKVARQRQDTGRKWAKRIVRDHDAVAVEDFHPKFLARSTMARKAQDAAIGATKQALIDMGRKHGRDIRLVHPAYTTMDCAQCGARAKHALPLGERTYTCSTCEAVSPRDKNSARVMLIRAGLLPADADGGRPPGAQLPEAA